MKKISGAVILAVLTVVVLISISGFVMPKSTSPCGPCHASYSQYLDVRESDAANQIPSSLKVGETKKVVIVIENICNILHHSVMSNVTATLSSQNGHFSVDNATCWLGTLSIGKADAAWNITGVSDGPDVLLIVASANNTHQSLSYTDSFSPAPEIVVGTGSAPEFPSLAIPAFFAIAIAVLISIRKIRNKT